MKTATPDDTRTNDRLTANFVCPRRDRELASAAWGAWKCQWYSDVIAVERGGPQ